MLCGVGLMISLSKVSLTALGNQSEAFLILIGSRRGGGGKLSKKGVIYLGGIVTVIVVRSQDLVGVRVGMMLLL